MHGGRDTVIVTVKSSVNSFKVQDGDCEGDCLVVSFKLLE